MPDVVTEADLEMVALAECEGDCVTERVPDVVTVADLEMVALAECEGDCVAERERELVAVGEGETEPLREPDWQLLPVGVDDVEREFLGERVLLTVEEGVREVLGEAEPVRVADEEPLVEGD